MGVEYKRVTIAQNINRFKTTRSHPRCGLFFYTKGDGVRKLHEQIDLDQFAERLFYTHNQYTELEWDIVKACQQVISRKTIRPHFSIEEVYQHGWYVLKTREVSTVGSFRASLMLYLTKQELLKDDRTKRFYDEPIDPTEPLDAIVRDILEAVKKKDHDAGSALQWRMEGYTHREIAERLNHPTHGNLEQLMKRGLDYAERLCT